MFTECPDPASVNKELRDPTVKVQLVRRTGKQLHPKVNGMDCRRPLEAERLQQWITAWKSTNFDALAELDTALAKAFEPLTDEQLGHNGQELQGLTSAEWFGSACFLQFTKLFAHAENKHFDGGAACSLLGLTLWGTRDLVCYPKDDRSDSIIFHQIPGAVYMTSMCPIQHQVRYDADDLKNLQHGVDTLLTPDLGEVGCHAIFRTQLFSHTYSQATKHLPSPREVWKRFNSSFLKWQTECTLRLPSLEAVQAAPPLDAPPRKEKRQGAAGQKMVDSD